MVVAVNNAALNSIQQILITDVEIKGELLNLTSSELKQVRMSNAENKHESVVITTQLTKAQIDRYVGAPITFHYGPRFSGSTFYGYVITINPNQDYQQDTIVDITCFGSTWPMQSGQPRFFLNSKASDVVANIVNSHSLGCQVEDDPYRWPALAQTDESDWEFIQTLAMRHGFAIYIYNGVVRMLNPKRVLNQSEVRQRYIRSDDVLDPSRQLLDFNATTQSLRIRDNVKPSFGYFDGVVPRLSQPLTVSPYRMSNDTPVKDKGMSDAYSEAWERRIDFWNQQATARINGNANIIPGVNISVQLSNNPSGRNEHDGVWFVRGVEHSFTNNSFQTSLDLARDTIGISPRNTDYRGTLSSTTQGSPKMQSVTRGNPPKKYWASSWTVPEFIRDTIRVSDPVPPIVIPTGMATPVIGNSLLGQ
jgi:hypothetical protein